MNYFVYHSFCLKIHVVQIVHILKGSFSIVKSYYK